MSTWLKKDTPQSRTTERENNMLIALADVVTYSKRNKYQETFSVSPRFRPGVLRQVGGSTDASVENS